MTLFLDTETTGLNPNFGDKIVEIAIIDQNSNVLLNTLVDPEMDIPYGASMIHGITNNMVRNYPTLDELWPKIKSITNNKELVIYNSQYDTSFFPSNLSNTKVIRCAMKKFTKFIGRSRWVKLTYAAEYVGHKWTGKAHRALADTLACRSVWKYMQNL